MGNETKILVNSEVKVTHMTPCSLALGYYGQTGIVIKVMSDGCILDVKLANGKRAMIDAVLVSVIQGPKQSIKSEPKLGLPIINTRKLKGARERLAA